MTACCFTVRGGVVFCQFVKLYICHTSPREGGVKVEFANVTKYAGFFKPSLMIEYRNFSFSHKIDVSAMTRSEISNLFGNVIYFPSSFSVHSPQTSQIQAVEEGSTRTCVGVIP